MMNQTQKHTTGKKLLALLLTLIMILSLLPTSVLATGSEPTVVIAGSDFQNPNGNDAGAQTVTNILTQMQSAGYTKADGFLCCGDYDYEYVETAAGITALKNAVTGTYSTLANDRMVFVQGNHDAAGSTGLAASGAHDAAEYGVFVINEDDYMWRNSDEATIRNTADKLKTYLDTKVGNGFDKPIFVVSHLPLHYSMRTRNDGDGMYANYIFDVLNDAGAKGLNIIFLYGHDHSNGWDDYLGGSCVYLAKGDKINIAQASQTVFKEETLNFTYMNAGFTGYYENHNGADDTLTMTVFSITDDTVTVERYDANGKHNLKSKGFTNSYNKESGYDPNTTVYGSPQTIALGSVTPLVTKTDGNVTVTAPGLTGLTAAKNTVSIDTSKYSAYVSYDITPVGYTQGDTATVTVTLDTEDGFDTSRKVTVIDQTGTNPDTTVSIVDGTVTFTTKHFSTYNIAQEATAEPTERTYTRVTSLDQLVDGQYLLIYNADTDKFMLPKVVSVTNNGTRVGFNVKDTDIAGPDTITGDYSTEEWTFTKDGDGWKIGTASGNITLTNTSNNGITATLASPGNTFTIGGSADSFTFQSGNYYLNYNSPRRLINGYGSNPAPFYIYRLTAGGSVTTSGGDWVTISDGQGKTIFRLANSLNSGKKYLIVNSGSAGSANAVNLNDTSINSASVTIIADAAGNYIEAPANTAQWTYTNADKFQNVSSTGRYLRGKKAGDSLKTTNDSEKGQTTWQYDANNGLYETSNNSYISSSFKMLSSGSSSDRVYIYEETTLSTTAEYAKITGSLEYTVVPGTSTAEALAAVKDGIDVVTSSDKTHVTTLPDDDANIKWTLDSSYDGTPGEYAVRISYKNKVLGTAKVVVPKLTVTKIEVNPMEGTVQRGASNYAKTGSTLTVTYSDGSTGTVDVTLGMLSGSFDKNTVGNYTGLTVTYGGKTVQNYTLHVTPKTGNNYPEYPHEGAVRVGKTGEGIDFQSSGIAKVELSATGVPVKKGADVIVMVDTSSSMTTTVDGSSKSRIKVLRESLTNLIRQFQAVGADGEPQDIRVAIADFNGYVTSGEDNTPYRLKSVDHLKGTTTRSGSNTAKVYTGSTQLNADAFVTAEQAASVISSIETHSGTNYDYAFDATYQLGKAILTRNEQDGEERDLFVIFMSDGAPFQYNYFSSQSEAANWNNWLQGTYASASDVPSDSEHKYFYNGSGNKHRMAEAIKGDPNEKYTVIRKDSTDNYGGQQYMTQLPGLGATMYSIGFCLEQDNQITIASMEYVLKNISSDPTKFYYKVNTADELSSAFTAIGNEIAYAATNARFVDTMGANYDLQMASSTYKLSDGTTKTITPKIIVQAYDIYTAADGVAPSEIGKRKGTSTVLETVTFKADGTEAYSDKKSGNILIDGVICANTFWYNTTGSAVSIDTNGDGTNDYNLAPETFYWKMGTINQTELALSYYVYLTGSMEGTREAGSYPTNESATLYYTNWLGNEAKKDTVSPVLAWKSANVSYAFYLVNANGKIIVNKSTGATGSFANKVAVTNPVVYSEVLLNNTANVQAEILASGVLPEGYTLYDASAAYNVRINSNSTGGWAITKGTDTATTYVTEYGGDPTTQLEATENSYDYTHTVVWFAVTYTVKAIPDAVVIDYGLPVDIHVLKNDMFYDKGELMYVGAEKTDGAVTGDANAAFTTNEFVGKYGKATVMANTSVPEDSVVRYTPSNMQMNGVDKFSYAVHYTGGENPGYYYGTVTVIPAANIYYEDSFVKFDGAWEPVGQAKDGITQQEDRPGQFSLSAYDANNVYGYDSAYTDCTTYSLGSAQKVTVNSETNSNPPTATFTFTGTGFDLISLTSNTTGTIFVEVYPVTNNKVGNILHRWAVDTYYGYTRTEKGYIKYTWTLTDGQWHANKEVITALPVGAEVGGTPQETGDITYEVNYQWTVTNDSNNALYQIPVIRGQGLEYGTYKVIIKPTYYPAFDNVPDSKDYDFYLDAVRIYDPAGKNPTGEIGDAYKADGEGWPNVIELRSQLIKEGTLNIDNDNSGSSKGIVFVDGIGDTGSIDNYTNYGPNNEVYLASGQAIAFKLKVDDTSKIASIQLAAKAPKGTAIAKVNDGTSTEITTATEMYYDITHRVTWSSSAETKSNTIVVANTGSNILSLTNIKITYKEAPVSAAEAQVDAQVLEEAPIMLLSMRGITAPVEPEPTFAPERFEAAWNRSTVRAGQKATLTVKTSEDVEAVMVDGVTIDTYRTRTQRTGWGQNATKVTYREFTYTITAAETADYAITAVNAEGIASEPITAALTVQAASQRPSFGGWLDKIFNRWF